MSGEGKRLGVSRACWDGRAPRVRGVGEPIWSWRTIWSWRIYLLVQPVLRVDSCRGDSCPVGSHQVGSNRWARESWARRPGSYRPGIPSGPLAAAEVHQRKSISGAPGAGRLGRYFDLLPRPDFAWTCQYSHYFEACRFPRLLHRSWLHCFLWRIQLGLWFL